MLPKKCIGLFILLSISPIPPKRPSSLTSKIYIKEKEKLKKIRGIWYEEKRVKTVKSKIISKHAWVDKA